MYRRTCLDKTQRQDSRINSIKFNARKFFFLAFFISYAISKYDIRGDILKLLKTIIPLIIAISCFLLWIFMENCHAAQVHNEVLIIDAGHGGADGGAEAGDGTLEADINLQIANQAKSLADFCGLEYIMTRDSDELSYPRDASTIRKKKVWDQKNRCKLINSTENGVLLSIHQNCYTSSAPYGPQVFYSDVPSGDVFAEIMQTNLNTSLCPENRRLSAPIYDGIYMMEQSKVPSILVECGFLSNPNELELLKSCKYQSKLAVVMIGSYLQFLDS